MTNSICLMKDVLKAFNDFEKDLIRTHSLSLNEAMLLCLLGDHAEGALSASDISERTGFSASHTSKVLRSAESHKWISRSLCTQDRRKMHFELTPEGIAKLKQLKNTPVAVPPLFNNLL
ncbi:MAG: winged helix DNA-binding protein [Bacteroidales bacterium]|jgi:DNA-binding MarR family transcriptional regulator|nr:winged helix DNA-binding protein [Bacteroidales bacterium]HKM31718.1 winged helix DNA-binding protein [Bacteroidales bacterium]